MKRLGLYVIISIMFVGVFLSPQKSLAAVTQSDVDALINQGVAAVSSISYIDQSSVAQKSYVAMMSTTANNLFQKIKNDTTVTQASLAWTVFNNYTIALEDLRQNASSENVKIINADINAIYPILTSTETAFQLEKKMITAGQASQMNAVAKTVAKENDVSLQKTLDPGSCSFLKLNLITCADQLFAWLIKNTLLELAGFLVWVSANMLNYAIQIGILGFSTWAPDTLYPIWIVVRQIVSLFIVFAGLWLGFMYIIGHDDKFKQYIPWVIIFALFVNFSYPLSRALIDVSNVVSLNIYTSAVGSEPLVGNNSVGQGAGALIMNRLGLQGLVMSATSVKDSTTAGGFLGAINSTPGALMAVAYVLYAAYIFFMATGIIAMRTAVLVFLVIASPVLFVDSVIPKLGDKAKDLRKMYFEQLMVAPVFMIMLALTLKFLEVFQAGPMGTASGALGSVVSGSSSSVVTFFNILMMLIMLHIMIKVTKSVSGSMGQYATEAMGKVGGFGLGVATGGAGLLARGSIGMAAARLRDSKTMDGWQGTRTGRGLYSLTNSMANSTYDTRNIGMVSKGLTKAGMGEGLLGTGMGQGAKTTYDSDFKNKSESMTKKYGSIRDVAAREQYLDQKTNTLGSRAQKGITYLNPLLGKNEKGKEERVSDNELIVRNIKKGEEKSVETYNKIKDEDKKREYFDSLPENVKDQIKSQKQPTQTISSTVATPKPANSEQKTEPLPNGYTSTPSGIIMPTKTSPTRTEGNYNLNTTTQAFSEYMKGKRNPGDTGAMSTSSTPKTPPQTGGAASKPANEKAVA